MSEQNMFFRWLYRLLAVGGLCLLLIVAYVLISSEVSSRRWQQRNTVTVQQPTADGKQVAEDLRFGQLETIHGSSMRVIKVESQVGRGSRLGLSSGSYGWDFRTRNLVFLPEDAANARWLFKDNNQYLGEIEQLCICSDGVKSPTLALYFEIAQGAGGGRTDAVVAALARTDGSSHAALGKPVTRVLGKSVSADGKTLGLLVEDQGKLLYRRFSLQTFEPISEQLVTQLQRQ